jgi:ABC-type branched-subunit amino acid transport system substrate-binding protein
MGEALANYLRHVLGGARAIVLFRDNGFGRPVAAGFKRAAERLGVASAEHGYTTAAQLEALAAAAAADPEKPAVILGMFNEDAVTALVTLRRQGNRGPVLGVDAIATMPLSDCLQASPSLPGIMASSPTEYMRCRP